MKLKIKVEHLEVPTEDWIRRMDGYSHEYDGATEYTDSEGYCLINVNQKGLAESPHTSPGILAAMVTDFVWDGSIQSLICENTLFLPVYGHMPSSFWKSGPTQLIIVANNRNTPQEILKLLCFHNNYKVREAIAKNLNAGPHVLECLENDVHNYVKNKLALNPNTPFKTLLKLSTDENKTIRERACQHSSYIHGGDSYEEKRFDKYEDILSINDIN